VKRLKDKVALITGSSRGIGRAIALRFAEEGAKVCINYVRSRDKAIEVAEKVKGLNGEAIIVQADVSKENEVEKMVNEVVGRFGRIDILVNNAGILYRSNLMDMDYREFRRMFDVNVMGVLYCCREAAKHMIRNRYGKIINIASVAGIGTALPDTTPYAITKAAVIMLTKRLAFELGRYGINVNAIAPGLILTDMVRLGFGETPEEVKKNIEAIKSKSTLGRIGEPDDVADVALFLASDESNFISGQVIVVDGGRMDFLSHST